MCLIDTAPSLGVAMTSAVLAADYMLSPFELEAYSLQGMKKMVAVVEKAIRESDLGLNPSTQGDMIRVPTPALTEERRKEMAKLVKVEGEDAKIAIRNIRRDGNETLKKLLKEKACSEDDERRAQDEVQKLTDKFVIEVDKLAAEKEKELMTV